MNGKNLYWFSPNFKLQISSIFHQYNLLFSPTKISYSINHRKFFKKYFLKRIFFYGKFNKYPDKRDYPIKGTIERIFHSRSEDSLKSIAKKVVPTLVPLGPILFPGIRERYRRIKRKKTQKQKQKKNKASLEWKSLVCIEKTDADIGSNDAEKLRCNPFAIVPLSLFSTTLSSHGVCFVKSSLLSEIK